MTGAPQPPIDSNYGAAAAQSQPGSGMDAPSGGATSPSDNGHRLGLAPNRGTGTSSNIDHTNIR